MAGVRCGPVAGQLLDGQFTAAGSDAGIQSAAARDENFSRTTQTAPAATAAAKNDDYRFARAAARTPRRVDCHRREH